MDAHASRSSSISTRARVVTFLPGSAQKCGLRGGFARTELRSSFVPPGDAQCGGSSICLSMVKKRPQAMHMEDGAGQLQSNVYL